ncbi:hypothetical protein ACF0H5_002450 [Mactra antiquata]
MKELRKSTGNVGTELERGRDLSSNNIATTTGARKWKPNKYIVYNNDEHSGTSRQTSTGTNNISEWIRKDAPQRSAYEYTEKYKKIKHRESEIRRDIMNIIQQKLSDVKDTETKSRGSKRRMDNEKGNDDDDTHRVKRKVTPNLNEATVIGNAHENISITVQHHTADRGKKRKSVEDNDTENEIKRSKIKFRLDAEKPCVSTTECTNSNTSLQCSNSCVCKVGPSAKPKPIPRRGDQPDKPLYQKLMQRRLLNTVNMVFFECCSQKCCEEWSKKRIPADMLENGFDKSNLRVDFFKWGQYEQKIDKVDTEDDWFW